MSDDKPVWLLDIDGVINTSRPGWGSSPIVRNIVVDGIEYRIKWASELITRIRRITSSEEVEVVWCSSWDKHVRLLEELWNLPQLGRVSMENGNPNKVLELKTKAALDLWIYNRRFIWTDDEVVPTEGDELHSLLTHENRSLLIKPKTRKGLQPGDVDRIEKFIYG